MNDRAGKPTEFTTIWQQKDCLSQYGEIWIGLCFACFALANKRFGRNTAIGR
jgi:hypothetical protein